MIFSSPECSGEVFFLRCLFELFWLYGCIMYVGCFAGIVSCRLRVYGWLDLLN